MVRIRRWLRAGATAKLSAQVLENEVLLFLKIGLHWYEYKDLSCTQRSLISNLLMLTSSDMISLLLGGDTC